MQREGKFGLENFDRPALETLIEITESVTELRRLPDFLSFVINKLQPIFGFHDVGVFILTENGKYHYDLAEAYVEISPSDWNKSLNNRSQYHTIHRNSLIEWMMDQMEKNNSIQLFDFVELEKQFPEYPHFHGLNIIALGYRDCLAANLKVGDQIIGMFCINQLEKNFFKEEQFLLFKAVTDQLAVAVSNILDNEEILKREREKTTLLEITEKVTKLRNLSEFLDFVVGNLKSIFRFHDVGVFLLSSDRKFHYDLAATDSFISPSAANQAHFSSGIQFVEHKDSLIEWMMEGIKEKRSPVLFDFKDLQSKYPDYYQFQWEGIKDYRDCLAANMVVGDHVLGMFCINKQEKDFFKEEQFPLFKSVTDQLAVAISNILSTEEILKREREKTLLLKITEKVTKLRNLQDFLTYVTEDLKKIFSFYDVGIIILSGDQSMHYDLAAMYPEISPSAANLAFKDSNISYETHSGSPAEYMMNMSEKAGGVILLDFKEIVEKFPDYVQSSTIKEMGYRDCLMANLKVGDQIFGFFCINKLEKGFFKEEQFPLFKGVTDQLAVAISNILANEDIQEREKIKSAQLNLVNGLNQEKQWKDKVWQLVSALKEHVDCHLVFFGVHPEGHTEYCHTYEQIGADEHRHLDYDHLIDFIDISEKEYLECVIRLQDALVLTDQELTDYTKENLYIKKIIEKFQVNSEMIIPLDIDIPGHYRLSFFSKRGNVYNETDLEFIKKVKPNLELAIEKLLAFERIEEFNQRLKKEKDYLQEEVNITYNFHEMIGETPEMEQVFEQVRQVARSETTVLILGETGTGKELIARAIHDASSRRDKPLVKLNCAALPEELVESELFGHEKGAFTGALKKRIGKFELAHEGTIFLDEIGELSLTVQAKLLRVLQEKEFEPVGSNQTVKADFRLITATNRNLEKAIEEKVFRMDLFYRLNTFPIILPPLRNRRDDIPLLVDHYGKIYSKKLGYPFLGFSQGSGQRLLHYHWPGNIRELQNVVEQAVLIGQGNALEYNPVSILHSPESSVSTIGSPMVSTPSAGSVKPLTADQIKQQKETLEREQILAVLDQARWRVRGAGGAAELLGLKPTTLESRMKKLGISKR